MQVEWKMFPLHPETPAEGKSLEALFNASSLEIKTMVDGLKHKAEELGLPFGDRTMTYNSRLAQELGIWAAENGYGHPFHMAAFKSYFAEGKNLADRTVLLEIVEKAGFLREQAEVILKNRSYRKEVDRDWHYCREQKVTAVPAFSMGEHTLVGAQNYETLEKLLFLNGFSKHKI